MIITDSDAAIILFFFFFKNRPYILFYVKHRKEYQLSKSFDFRKFAIFQGIHRENVLIYPMASENFISLDKTVV